MPSSPPPKRSRARRRSAVDPLEAAAQKARESHNVFMETVWKDPKGQRVKQAAHHQVMGRFLDEAYARKIPALLLAPLGSGKSEQGQAFIARRLGEDPKIRAGIVCDKDEHAAQRVDNIAGYIDTDPDFQALYPKIKIRSDRRNRLMFKTVQNTHSKDWSLEGAGVLSSGTGTRKDIIFFDDCVTKKNAILEPAQRPRVILGYNGTWIGRIVPAGWHFYIGTMYHAADLTNALIDKKDRRGNYVYAFLKIGVSDEMDAYDIEERWPGEEVKKYQVPLWEGEWDQKAYEERHDLLVDEGEAIEWYTGYKNMIVDPGAMEFQQEWFYRQYPIKDLSSYPIRVLYADPASTDAAESDNYAGCVLAFDPGLQACVMLDGWYVRNEGLGARVDRYLDVWERWRPHIAGVEGKHELSFAQRIEEVAAERGLPFRLRKLNHRIDKEVRIGGLAPLVERAKIMVDARQFPWFVAEAMFFPKAKYDDGLDSLEGAYTYVRRWMRARGAVPDRFSVGAQYHATGKAHKQGHRYTFQRPRKDGVPPSVPTPGRYERLFLR